MFQFFRSSSSGLKRQKVERSEGDTTQNHSATTPFCSENAPSEEQSDTNVCSDAGKEKVEAISPDIFLPDLSVSTITSSSVTLGWEVDIEGLDSLAPSHFRIRYHRQQFRTDVWRYSEVVQDASEAVIQGLEPQMEYAFQLQVAAAEPSDDSPMSDEEKATPVPRLDWKSTTSVLATTWNEEKEERVGNLLRIHRFLMGNLEDYPEDEHIPDTYLDKAARSFEGILSVAGMVGAGGKWLKIARDGWKMRQYGLAALIFREDLQRIMVTLGTHVGRLAEEMGLSNKELILGSYYYFWERKRERLIYPGKFVCFHTRVIIPRLHLFHLNGCF